MIHCPIHALFTMYSLHTQVEKILLYDYIRHSTLQRGIMLYLMLYFGKTDSS